MTQAAPNTYLDADLPLGDAAPLPPSPFKDYYELAKPRIAQMVVITAAVGFFFGMDSLHALKGWTVLTFLATCAGTALTCCGSAVLNQLIERDTDALMERTRNRPLPAGRIQPPAALAYGVGLIVVGLAVLALCTNAWAVGACAFTVATYLGVYTPLKRVTWTSTHIGAIPGAMPPVIGYAAATGTIGTPAWVLFALMLVWQLPHFLAIAWLYRDQYANAGLVMLPVIDHEDGRRTFRQTLIGCAVLLPLGMLPTLTGMTGWWTFALATVCGVAFLLSAVKLVRVRTRAAARRLFFVSLIYLPVVLLVMVLDRA